jgi:hypothetical protein
MLAPASRWNARRWPIGQVFALLRPLIDALERHVMAGGRLYADDATVPVRAPGTGKTKTGRPWAYLRDERPHGGTGPPAVRDPLRTVRWPALTRYLDDGTVAIDNNAVERAIRPLVLGRKNWLFAGSDQGGEHAVAVYSLIEVRN